MRQQKVRTVQSGLETALYWAPQVWSLVPADHCLMLIYFNQKQSIGNVLNVLANSVRPT